jgi:small nuclear ribonucleoprotein (snRNP)-like protein
MKVTAAELKPLQDRTVYLELCDGEKINAKIVYVDEEYDDVIVDILDTNRPTRYEAKDTAYTIALSEIVFARLYDGK